MNGYERRSRQRNCRDSRHGIKKAAEMGLLCESFLGGAGEVAFVALSATVFCDLHSA